MCPFHPHLFPFATCPHLGPLNTLIEMCSRRDAQIFADYCKCWGDRCRSFPYNHPYCKPIRGQQRKGFKKYDSSCRTVKDFINPVVLSWHHWLSQHSPIRRQNIMVLQTLVWSWAHASKDVSHSLNSCIRKTRRSSRWPGHGARRPPLPVS